MSKKEYKILQQATKIMLKISKEDFGICKAFGFHCPSCEVFDLATRFDSFVNFYLDDLGV